MLSQNRKIRKISWLFITSAAMTNLASANELAIEREIKILQTSDRILAEPIFDEKHHLRANITINPSATKLCGKSEYSPSEVKKIASAMAEKYNVSKEIVLNVIKVESNFDRNRNSPKGARGAMQLMPETAKAFGVKDVCDTVQNIEGGTKFLKQLLEKYGSVKMALAAYNAGEPVVDRTGGIPAIAETQKYVTTIAESIIPPSEKKENQAGIIIGSASPVFKNGVLNFNGE